MFFKQWVATHYWVLKPGQTVKNSVKQNGVKNLSMLTSSKGKCSVTEGCEVYVDEEGYDI